MVTGVWASLRAVVGAVVHEDGVGVRVDFDKGGIDEIGETAYDTGRFSV